MAVFVIKLGAKFLARPKAGKPTYTSRISEAVLFGSLEEAKKDARGKEYAVELGKGL